MSPTSRRRRTTIIRRSSDFVVPASGYYFAIVLEGIRSAARDVGVRIVLAVSGYSGERERRRIAGLVELGASGLIVSPSPTVNLESERSPTWPA
ncbi:LacI family transcriptional regulator [Cryobacterium sp. Sr8]|uniref:LacI family transcriptional regulator n=1 Tax=Cryobacterium sp. Sr8 TaxID=1259203 RepID=UPI00106AF0F2|nr:LacI family transcriptional regulator [Cryobacterium sp. Sr8]TFD80620.1 LacI family transcriptional regulator [Cryobacterium sp. Sr8]